VPNTHYATGEVDGLITFSDDEVAH